MEWVGRGTEPQRTSQGTRTTTGIDVETTTAIGEAMMAAAGEVHFDNRSNRGTPCRTDIVTHLTCNCGGSDINSTYRQCLVSLAKSSTYFTALTLFDTGAYTSFVNREVAKWLEQRQEGNERL